MHQLGNFLSGVKSSQIGLDSSFFQNVHQGLDNSLGKVTTVYSSRKGALKSMS